MSSLFYTTQKCVHPMLEVAPFLETGTKLPYNMKIYRGRATLGGVAAGTFRIYDVDTTQQIMFPRNCFVLVVGLLSSTTLATVSNQAVTVGLGVNNTTPAITTAIASTISPASINLGCAVKYGDYAGAGTNSVASAVGSTNNVYPFVSYTGTTLTAGVIQLTFVVIETDN